MLIPEKIPKGLVVEEVRILSPSRETWTPGKAAVKRWTPFESFARGFRKAAKLAFILLVLPLPLAFVEPFLFMIWGSVLGLLLIAVVGPVLHFLYSAESESFFYVDGACAHCAKEGRLTPFVSTSYKSEGFVVLCAACGQNSEVSRQTAAGSGGSSG